MASSRLSIRKCNRGLSIFFKAVEIILAQSSLDSYGTSHLRPCSFTVFENVRSTDQPAYVSHARRRLVSLEERSCSCPHGGRFSSVLACSPH
jgi:hypothetical protein